MRLSTFFRQVGLLAAVLVLLPAAHAQSLADAFWTDVSEASITSLGVRTSTPAAYRTLSLNRDAMASRLAQAPQEADGFANAVEIPVPTSDGGMMWFRVVESSIMAPSLQAKYPEIRTYVGQGRDVPSATGRFSLTPAGFAAMASTPDGTIYVDPYAIGDADNYLAYRRADVVLTEEQRAALAAELQDDAAQGDAGQFAPTTTNGANLRTYRLAMAATGEYTAFHGGTVAGGMAAIVTAMNRVNQIYQIDLSVRMELVANNDLLVYTDAATDPYTNVTNGAALATNQTNINTVIGSANYDIGHLVATGDGGIAGLGVVCSASNKARGTTGLPTPTGDAFYIDYVAHEMGHQFRGNHSFNGNGGSCGGGNRNATTSVEPGSGSTIMAYAGICGTNNTQNNSDAYFHAISLQEIVGFITSGVGSTCGTVTATGNDVPVVTAPADATIPISTAFVLTGSATDATQAALTYNWEEMDPGTGTGATASTNGVPNGPPFFRSFNSSLSPTRYFPQLSRTLAGQLPVRGEALPATAATLNFRLTVRDNRAAGGAIADDNIVVTTDAGAGPFVVTFANTAGQSFSGNSTQTVTWNVANTDPGGTDGVNVANVQILFSPNAATGFDTVLLASTPNDGSADVVIPSVITTTGRIMVKAVDNIFYDVNDFNFATTPVADEAGATSVQTGLSAVSPNPATGSAQFVLRSTGTEAVTVGVYDALGRRVALLHDGPVSLEQAFTVDVSALPAGVYVVRASGGTATSTQRFTVVR